MSIGEFTHVEIPADDVERAQRFYGGVFGWTFGEMEGFPDYFLFASVPQKAGGAIGTRGETVSAHLVPYMVVASIDDVLSAVERHGGSVKTPRSEVPGQGWYAVLVDTEGNELGLWEGPTDS